MRPLVIIGAGGLAQETAAAIEAVNEQHSAWELLGYLDDDPDLEGTILAGRPILGSIGILPQLDAPSLLVCVGGPLTNRRRKAVVERLGVAPEDFATIVHPTAVLPRGTEVGVGTILLANVVVTAPIKIGAHVVVMPSVVLTHDDVIGDFVTFGSGVHLGGRVTIGDGAYIGAAAAVREDGRVGAGSVVGMGAVVTKEIPAGQLWTGVPARRLRDLP